MPQTEVRLGKRESQEVFMWLDFALPLSKYMVLAVLGLWKMIIDSVPNVLPHRDTEKMFIKHLYLLGDRHYVNKVKFLL